jgi:hypothetical protein
MLRGLSQVKWRISEAEAVEIAMKAVAITVASVWSLAFMVALVGPNSNSEAGC